MKIFNKLFKLIISVMVGILFSLPFVLLKDQLQNLATLGYIGLFVSCLISNATVMLPSSSTLIVLVASMTFDPLLCVLSGGIGTALGEQCSYLCGMIGSSHISTNNNIERWIRKRPFMLVFLFAFLPLPIFDVVGIASGILRFNWIKYSLAATAGKLLKFSLVVMIFHVLVPVFLSNYGEYIPDIILELVKGFV